jgi:Spy/CpxP family protein refolding chaperone
VKAFTSLGGGIFKRKIERGMNHKLGRVTRFLDFETGEAVKVNLLIKKPRKEEKMISRSKILVFLLALLLMTGSVYAMGPGDSGPGEGPKGNHMSLLNLTPEQKTKLQALRENFRKETVFLRNDIKVKRLELKTLWTVPKPDKDKIIAKQKELVDLTTQLKMKAIDFRLEARSTLTPDQAAQVGMWGPEMGHRGHMGRRMWAQRQ